MATARRIELTAEEEQTLRMWTRAGTTEPVMRGGAWASKKQLVEQIMYYIKCYNEDAAPFAWNYTGKPVTV